MDLACIISFLPLESLRDEDELDSQADVSVDILDSLSSNVLHPAIKAIRFESEAQQIVRALSSTPEFGKSLVEDANDALMLMEERLKMKSMFFSSTYFNFRLSS